VPHPGILLALVLTQDSYPGQVRRSLEAHASGQRMPLSPLPENAGISRQQRLRRDAVMASACVG
jgi:hypothetical protein